MRTTEWRDPVECEGCGKMTRETCDGLPGDYCPPCGKGVDPGPSDHEERMGERRAMGIID